MQIYEFLKFRDFAHRLQVIMPMLKKKSEFRMHVGQNARICCELKLGFNFFFEFACNLYMHLFFPIMSFFLDKEGFSHVAKIPEEFPGNYRIG